MLLTLFNHVVTYLLVLPVLITIRVAASPVIDARQSSPENTGGWTPVGCYSDLSSSRTIRVASFTSVENMTIEACTKFCTPTGYRFAGLEFARECYCDNIIQTPGAPISPDSCNMPCTGDSTEICGGPDAINIFENPQLPPLLPAGWIEVGCYSDSITERTLRTAAFTSITNMTIELCLDFCTPHNYNYAGVEFARECYCDMAIETPGVLIDPKSCNAPCTGNKVEICGGAGAISVFQNTAVPPPPPVPIVKEVSGFYRYIGCFFDGVHGAPRTMNSQMIGAGATVETCCAICTDNGFVLSGLEWGGQCWCASAVNMTELAPDADCNSVCDGDHTEVCGAGNRLTIYQNTNVLPLDN